jgi:hypothetical protein
MATAKKNLREKLAAIAGDIGDIKPDGYNEFHRYKYFSDEQLSGIFRKRFADAGVIVVPYVENIDVASFQTDKGKHSFLTTLTVMWRILDTDSDEQLTARTIGQGDDPGDKGANKAMTGAFKYLLIKMFQVGGESSDAEADTSTDERHTDEKPSRKAKVSRPKARVENVQKGGRQANATEVQVDRISVLARELGIGFDGMANVIKNTLSVDVELPDDVEEKKRVLRSFLESLTAEDIGKIAQALETAKERAQDV